MTSQIILYFNDKLSGFQIQQLVEIKPGIHSQFYKMHNFYVKWFVSKFPKIEKNSMYAFA